MVAACAHMLASPWMHVSLLTLAFSLLVRTSSTILSLTSGSSLNVQNKQDVLLSSNQVFSAGFYNVGFNAFCFAIWFTADDAPMSDQSHTVVWIANRDYPVNGKHSKLSLLNNGNLVLLDDAAQWHSPVWETATTLSTSILTLTLGDDGNLILHTRDGERLWQSFDSPTDTLLPNQPITRGMVLVSSRSRTNFSSGFYKFRFDDYNILRLSFSNLEISSLYWPYAWQHTAETNRTMYNNSRIALLDTYGHFMSSDNLHFTTSDFGLRIWRRLILEPDGNIRVYSLYKKNKAWEVTWQAISQPCRIHGVCGANSMCTYSQKSGRKCKCLPGHKMKVQTDWSYGCEPDYKAPDDGGSTTFGFLQLSQSDFYGYDSGFFVNFTLDRCKQECLSHYNCKGFLFRPKNYKGENLCYAKRALLNGQQIFDIGSNIYVKLPTSIIKMYRKKINPLEEKSNLNCTGQDIIHISRAYKKNNQNDSVRYMLWFVCALGGLEMIALAYFLFVNMNTYETNQVYHQVATAFRRFSYDELKKATNNFSQEIGQGGSSIVYKGILFDNRVAAIKRFKEENFQGEAEFLAEISIIERLNHINLIETWGYCIKGKHRFLVSEYLNNGSLAENLSSNTTLDWEKRYKIALGTARGLAYLHEECLEWVLHCDVKPQNILLDSNFEPKVVDFGLSKLLKRDAINTTTMFSRIRGTRGYMAPEWASNQRITSKVDVYSYGIVTLEMITGRSPTMNVCDSNDGSSISEQKMLVKWISEKMQLARENGKESPIVDIVDPRMNGMYDLLKMKKLVQVALQCVEDHESARPTMSQVVTIRSPLKMRRSITEVSGNSATVDSTLSPAEFSLYEEGEKVLALHKRNWYAAKVQKVESRMGEWTYYIHYLGWKKTWDEWMGIDRLRKFTEEDAQMQCNDSAMAKNIKSDHVSRSKTKHFDAIGKKGRDDCVSKEKSMITEGKMMYIEIPPSLKKQLLDDCEFVTHLGKLVKLPRTPTVDEILKKYFAYRVKKKSMSSEAIQEILSGLRCYFDKALSAMLLYRNERKQYEQMITEHISPSTVYGAEHLLRLFVKLPEILYDANIEEETIMKLQPKILDLLNFLQKNQGAYFLSTYETPENLQAELEV